MEFLLPYACSISAVPISTISAFLLFLFSFIWISRSILHKNTSNKRKGPPEAAGAWPILGHLPLLEGPQLPHVTLGKMADKYGPLFSIKLGMHRTLVVSNWEMAKECLTTDDTAFGDRPKSLATKIMAYDYAMFGFSAYGSYWRQMRKMTALHLLTNHKVESLKFIFESEVRESTKQVYDMWKQQKGVSDKVLVDMKKWFKDLTVNTVSRILVGKRIVGGTTAQEKEDNERFQNAMSDFIKLGGAFVISDVVPFVRWLDLGGYEKAMKKTAKALDSSLQKWLDEHKQNRSSDCGERDFMDTMLSVLDDDSTKDLAAGSYTADTIYKSTCLALFLGGTDTTTVTLTWALSLLLNNPEVLKKAQLELDNLVGRERQMNVSDVKNLVYLQAIIKETMRLYPPGPFSVQRVAREDCRIGNYHVSAGTRLLINLTKIQKDPNVWLDPCEFQPERFLTKHKDIDVKGQHFELLPFGGGRRICPGISFSLQLIQLTLAHLLHAYDITSPFHGPVDMGESSGMTNMKSSPLEVLLTPSLHAHLYENV